MKKKAEYQLIGRKIESANFIHDYLQIRFEDGSVMNIFNAIELSGFFAGDISKSIGCNIINFEGDDRAITISLGAGKTIKIGTLDEDYRGPEAIEYRGADGSIVIWG